MTAFEFASVVAAYAIGGFAALIGTRKIETLAGRLLLFLVGIAAFAGVLALLTWGRS